MSNVKIGSAEEVIAQLAFELRESKQRYALVDAASLQLIEAFAKLVAQEPIKVTSFENARHQLYISMPGRYHNEPAQVVVRAQRKQDECEIAVWLEVNGAPSQITTRPLKYRALSNEIVGPVVALADELRAYESALDILGLMFATFVRTHVRS